jgi:hypothetical protein
VENPSLLTHVGVLELREADLRRALRVAMCGEIVGVAVLFLDVGVWRSQFGGL